MTGFPELPSTEVMQAIAEQVGACLRPIMQRLTDTTTGDTTTVAIPCGATLASSCPSCAERNRKLRMQQCREGWHLTDDPIPDDQDDDKHQADGDEEPADD